jgi:hypothetical protein
MFLLILTIAKLNAYYIDVCGREQKKLIAKEWADDTEDVLFNK